MRLYYLANFGVRRCMLRNNLSLCRSFPFIHASNVNNGSIGIIERSSIEKPGVSLNCCSCTNFLSTIENGEDEEIHYFFSWRASI